MGTEGGGDGSSEIGTSDGIIPRVVYDLFQCVRQYNETHADKSNGNSNSDDNSGNKVKIELSYLEIYNEECRDLLVTSNNISDHKDLVLRESSGNNGAGGGVRVVGLSRVSVTSPHEVAQYMQRASERRVTGSTKMNSTSSRSHAICTIQVTLPNVTSNDDDDDDKSNNDDDGGVLTSKLTLVDLAGSERIKRTGAEGHRLKEGISINKGLFVLGQVVSALSEMGASSPSSSNSNSSTSTDIRETNLHQHVPYRDSKLTRLLQDSLGGNSRTILVACVSPADTNVEETMNTLRYAERARNIKNSAVRNLVASSSSNKAEVKMLRKENQVLRMQLSKAQETIRQFSKLSGMNSMAPPLATTSSSFHTSNESTSIVNRNSSTSVNMIPDVFTDENMISSNKNNENMKLQMTCIALQTKLKGTNDRLQRVAERVLQESNRADHYQVQYDGLFHAILKLDKKDHEGQQQHLPLILSQFGKQMKMKNSDKKSLVEHQREEIESLKEQLYESRVDVNVLRATAAILMRQHQKNTTENDKNTDDEENVNLVGFSLAQNHDDKNDSDSYSDLSINSNVVEDMTVEFSNINADIERKVVMLSQLANEVCSHIFVSMRLNLNVVTLIAIIKGRCFDETMRNQFETTIQNLNKEIEVLSSERNQLMQDVEQQQQSTSSTNKVAQNQKQPKLLRERIASLENKIKSLKSKSADHTRVLREREIAQRKCAQLQLEIADDKRRRVSLQRKLKEEATERKNERAEARKEATRLVRDGNRLKMEISKIKETAAKQAAVLRRKAAEASAKLKTETEKKKRQQLANETKSSLSITQYQKENVLNWLEREIQMGDTIKSTKIQLDEEKEFLGIAKDKKNNLLTQQERGNYVIKELQIVNDEITARSMAINHLQRTLDEITPYSKDSDVSFMNKKIWESLSRNELRFSLLNLFELLVMSKIELNDLRNKADERVLVAVNNAVQDEKRKSQETLLLLKMEHSESMMTLLNTTKDALSQKFKDEMFLVSNTSNIEQHTKTVIDKILEPYFLGCDKIGNKLHHDLQEVKDAQNGMKLLYDQLAEGVIMRPKQKKKKDRESVDHDLMEKLFEDDVPEGYDSDDSDWSPTSPAKSKKAKKIDIKKLQPSEISTAKHTM